MSVFIYSIFSALHYLCWFTALLIQNDACIVAMLKLKIVINQTDGCLAWVDIQTPVYQLLMRMLVLSRKSSI
jgi:hypothetical protein